MVTVFVERELEPGTQLEAVQAAEDAVAWCLSQHRVRFLRTYLSLDGSKMVCVYEAPDAESVRETQRRAGLPVAHAFSVLPVGELRGVSARAGMSTVIVQRAFEAPIPPDVVLEAMRSGASCFSTHRATLLASNLSTDLTRMVCVFEAPDAESVRMANRQIGVPFTRVWTANVSVAP